MFSCAAMLALVGVPLVLLAVGCLVYIPFRRAQGLRLVKTPAWQAIFFRVVGVVYMVFVVALFGLTVFNAIVDLRNGRYPLGAVLPLVFLGVGIYAGWRLFRLPRLLMAWAGGALSWALVGMAMGFISEVLAWNSEELAVASPVGLPLALAVIGFVLGPAAGVGLLMCRRAWQYRAVRLATAGRGDLGKGEAGQEPVGQDSEE